MVFEDGSVENRLMRTPAGVTPSALTEASNFLNSRLTGRTLAEASAEIHGELDGARRRARRRGGAAGRGGAGRLERRRGRRPAR